MISSDEENFADNQSATLEVPEPPEPNKRRGSAPATSLMQSSPMNTPEPRRKSDSDDTLKETPNNSRSQQFIQKYKHSLADVSPDILRTIEEVCYSFFTFTLY